MTSLPLLTATICLFACVYGWGDGGQQYRPQYPYGQYHSGYPYGPFHHFGRDGFQGAVGARRRGGGDRPGQRVAGRGAGGVGMAGDAGRPGRGGAGRPGQGAGSTGGAAGVGISGAAGRDGGTGNAGPRRPSGPKPGQKLPQPEKYVNPQDAVASSVVRTTDQYFYKAGPVGFDKVITNINGGYNPEYGVFTAPVPGIYDIKYQVQTKEGSPKLAHVDLTKNGEVVNSAKAKGDCATASNSAVLYLDQFDRLSVNGREGTVIGCEDNNFCSFSVSLVKAGEFNDQKIPRAVPMDKW